MNSPSIRLAAVALLAAATARHAPAAEIHDAAFAGDLATLRRIVTQDPGQASALDDKDRPAVGRAARGGHLDAVMFLLDAGAPHADNAAWQAADAGHLGLLQALLERGVSTHTTNEYGTTLLMFAASSDHVDICRFLVGLGLEPGFAKADGRTALHYAAQYGGPAAARYLLELGVPADALTKNGWSPLHYAARNDNVEVMRELMRRGADIRRKTTQRTGDDGRKLGDHAPLHLAAIYGHSNAARFLLAAEAPVDAWNFHYRTPLMYAATNRHHDTAALLLASGADTEISDFSNETALHKACRGDDTEMIRLLVEHGADVRAETGVGYGPVVFAVGKANTEAVRILVEAGGNPNAIYDGNTALAVGAVKGHVDLVRVLLENGASVRTEDNGGDVLLAEAAYKGNLQIVKLLVEHGADPTERKQATSYGQPVEGGYITPVWAAAKSENVALVRYLVEQGALMDLPGPMEMTPLEIASARGHLPMMTLLIEHGAAIDGAGEGSPLTSAAGLDRLAAVELLIELGADPDGRDGQREYRPLHVAAAHGRVEIARRLIAAGADTTLVSQSFTPLVVAVRNEQRAMVTLMLDQGVDPGVAANGGTSVLFEAIDDDAPFVLQLLLTHETVRRQIEHRLGSGRTPLHQATRLGCDQAVMMLLEAGADIDAVVSPDAPRPRRFDDRGMTALEIAEWHLAQDFQPDSYEASLNTSFSLIASVLRLHAID